MENKGMKDARELHWLFFKNEVDEYKDRWIKKIKILAKIQGYKFLIIGNKGIVITKNEASFNKVKSSFHSIGFNIIETTTL